MPKQQTPTLPELVELIACLDLLQAGYAVTRHPYRQRRVVGSAVTDGPFHYELDDGFDSFQKRLAECVGREVGNHETYEVVTPGGQKLFLWFHDYTLAVGTTTEPYS